MIGVIFVVTLKWSLTASLIEFILCNNSEYTIKFEDIQLSFQLCKTLNLKPVGFIKWPIKYYFFLVKAFFWRDCICFLWISRVNLFVNTKEPANIFTMFDVTGTKWTLLPHHICKQNPFNFIKIRNFLQNPIKIVLSSNKRDPFLNLLLFFDNESFRNNSKKFFLKQTFGTNTGFHLERIYYIIS